MKLSGIKYLMVVICLFSIMEKTGISAISLFAKIHLTTANTQAGKESNDNTESRETKTAEVKEYWAAVTDHNVLSPAIHIQKIKYYSKATTLHLNWCPPVATPPPNFQV